MDLLEVDVRTGRRNTLAASARKALRALLDAEVPFAVIGAVALAVRGLPRMTRDLDVVVTTDDAFDVLTKGKDEVDVLVTSGEPESTVIAEATRAPVFGVTSPVATLEQLVLMYLYSNQPRHFADLARIVTETSVDLTAIQRYLDEVHPEMLPTLRERVHTAKHPPAPPPRPPARKRSTKR